MGAVFWQANGQGGAAKGGFLLQSEEALKVLLDAYLLETAVYELVYALNNRPDWVKIPLGGVQNLLAQRKADGGGEA